MTVLEAVKYARERLSAVTGEGAVEGRAMVCFLMGAEYRDFLMVSGAEFAGDRREKLDAMIGQRLEGEPLQYILGEWEFMGLPFYTRPWALIPRQDTETLCQEALKIGGKTVLDMCCGTGCIGVSLAKLGGMKPAFSDISPRCVSLARKNAGRNGVTGRYYLGDLFEKVTGRYSLICCNPPYIPRGELKRLQREVRREPAVALDGGYDGLEVYRRLALGCRSYLKPGGHMLLEVGMGQAQAVMDIFGGGRPVKDLNGIDRVVVI